MDPVRDDVEIFGRPAFSPGEKVKALCPVRNDGTFPGRATGDRLVWEGDVGYVADVGTFLQRYYIYSVDWIERGVLVGMRAHELASLDRPLPENHGDDA